MAGKKRSPTPTLPYSQQVVTVRMPSELHETLKAMAHWRGVSMNRLCVSLLSGEPIRAEEGSPPERLRQEDSA